jgi:hypothetical protein
MKRNKILLRVPSTFLLERSYLAKVIFEEFLGVDFDIETDHLLTDKYIVSCGDNYILLFDDFFAKTDEEHGYLLEDLIPAQVDFVNDGFINGKDIPLVYGTGGISVEPDRLICGHDIFASVFFMLTRWEEVVIKETDYLERFPAKRALAVRHGFLHRPVVNEWIAMLQNMLLYLNPSMRFRQPQTFQINFTHDIDHLNSPVSVKEFAKDIIRRKSLSAVNIRMSYFIKKENPYDVFDHFMDVSEKNNSLSRFYFMTGHNIPGKDGEPYNQTPLYRKMLKRIRERGHVIGFHPSLLTFNDTDMFSKEKKLLEQDIQAPVTEGRQHALRFQMPETWRMWEQNNMETDSTLGYSAIEGFRCGTGHTFSTFDVVNRKALALKEMPLVIMDTTLHVNRKLGLQESEAAIRNLINTGRHYNTPVTLLFHNLIKDKIDWSNWMWLYNNLFNS